MKCHSKEWKTFSKCNSKSKSSRDIMKRYGDNGSPCLTPLFIVKKSERWPLFCIEEDIWPTVSLYGQRYRIKVFRVWSAIPKNEKPFRSPTVRVILEFRSFSVFFLLNQRLAVYIHKCIFFFFFFFYKTLSFTYHVAEMDFDPVCYAGGSYFIHDTNLLFRLSFNDFFLCF